MAARFFHSIPTSVTVADPYEEVFALFTTETADTWAHNRSVSQKSTQLELELDYTPVPSPSVSQPSSRPSSRSSHFSSVNIGSDGSETIFPGSGSGSAFIENTHTGSRDSEDSCSTSESSSLPVSNPQRLKTPVSRLMTNRKPNRSESPGVNKPLKKKPLVIHQSLSTLSQPGQTGTVVWDSSILMSKFMLSIKGLTLGYYYSQLTQNQNPSQSERELDQQLERIAKLEEQAEELNVSGNGDLEKKASKINNHLANQSNCSLDETTIKEEIDNEWESTEDDDADMGEINNMLIFDPAETSILELGSGCGLLGIVMVEFCQHLLLTDQKPVLPLLVKNLRKNLDKKYFDQDLVENSSNSSNTASDASPAKKKKKERNVNSMNGKSSEVLPCRIQIQELVWGQELDQDLRRGVGVDFVIATDVVYNESVVPLLVRTLKDLCEIRERTRHGYKLGRGEAFDKVEEAVTQISSNSEDEESQVRSKRSRLRRMMNKTVVLIAQELRTDYVHLSFLEELMEAGFKAVRIPKDFMDGDFQSGYVIYACFLNGKQQ
ncbi:hypothetical protein BGZ76_005642 [Entomortierella beljakovae]|nr:hypothetical protein BGZ76_005642 [Entomortierella beljakovae]